MQWHVCPAKPQMKRLPSFKHLTVYILQKLAKLTIEVRISNILRERRGMKTLKELRKEKGIKQDAIAKQLGISRQTYATYEAHPERLTIAQAKLLCSFLGCDFDFIVPVEVCLTNSATGAL